MGRVSGRGTQIALIEREPARRGAGGYQENRASWRFAAEKSRGKMLQFFTERYSSKFGARFKKGSGTVAGTAGHRPKVGRVLRTTVPDPFLNQAKFGGLISGTCSFELCGEL
jgi:hypothetical protein